MAIEEGGDDTGNGGTSGGKKGKDKKGHKHPQHPKARHPRTGHGSRGHRGGGRGHKPHVVHPGTFHEVAGAGSAGHTAGASPAQGHLSAQAGSGMAAHVIRPGSAGLSTGLSDVLLELVGEGTITLGAALGAWQRDQERVTNRAWRRPGGLARMGGL